MKRSWKLSVVDETIRVIRWMFRIGDYDEKVNGMGLETDKKAVRDDGKLKIPQFSDWIPNVPYLEIVECYSGIEI